MRKCKNTMASMLITSVLSLCIIIICNASVFCSLRTIISDYIVFLDGKSNIISNIFIGILGSSIISMFGYLYEYFNEKNIQEENIKRLFRTMYYNCLINIGKEDIQYIKDLYIDHNNNFFEKLHAYKNNYCRIINTQNNDYRLAINIMYNIEVYYFRMIQLLNTKNTLIFMMENIKKDIDWIKNEDCQECIVNTEQQLTKMQEYLEEIVKEENNEREKIIKKKDLLNQQILKLSIAFNLYDCEMDFLTKTHGQDLLQRKGV